MRRGGRLADKTHARSRVRAVLSASVSAEAQQCREGARATLTGTIGKLQQGEPEPGERVFMITPNGKVGGACNVSQIWGRGRAPAECAQGKTFSATGKVMDAESMVLLNVEKIACK